MLRRPPHRVLAWAREAWPDGVPDDDQFPLAALLAQYLGREDARFVTQALGIGADVPADRLLGADQVARVAGRLVAAGWPLADLSDDEEAPAEGSRLGRIVAWLREGYPAGVPQHDYLPLLAILERRLTNREVKRVAKELRRAEISPAGPEDIAAAIQDLTRVEASPTDLDRVRARLAKKGWPLDFPDPGSRPAEPERPADEPA